MLRNCKIANLLTSAVTAPLRPIGKGAVGTARFVGKKVMEHPGPALAVGLGGAAIASDMGGRLAKARAGMTPAYEQARRASGFRLPPHPSEV
jgi:hypothetical protein